MRRAVEPVALTMAVVLALTACTSAPTPSPTLAPSSPPIATAPPTPTAGPTPTASGSTASSQPFGLSSQGAVDLAGTFRPGGLWAIRGTTLFISTDAGDHWRRSSIPAPGTFLAPGNTFLHDPLHAWSISLGPGTTNLTGSSTDVMRFVVHRTTDGGKIWRASPVSGNYAGTNPSVAFADSRHGYLLAAAGRFSFGTSTVLRTDDGGATWSVAGTSPWLGSLLAVNDASTVWAGGEQQAGGMFEQPVLAVSRDGGRTWRAVALPGTTGTTENGCGCYLAEPPLFLNATAGYVTVVANRADGTTDTRIERTADGGRTWSQVAYRSGVNSVGLAILDPTHWLVPVINPSGVEATSDAGATWTTVSSGGAWDQTFGLWIGALDSLRAAALVSVPDSPDARLSALILTTDGGRTWHQIDVGR